MPPATLAPSVSLRELADLAIGTPEVGAVNFTALHTLIVAMLKNLNLQEARINYQAQLPEQSRSFETPRASSSTPQLPVSKERRRSSVSGAPPQALESKVKDLSGQVQDLSRQLKTVESQVQAIVAHMQHVTVQTSGLQAREWLEAKEMDLLAQEKALRESMRVWKDREPVPEVGAVRQAGARGAAGPEAPSQAALRRPLEPSPEKALRESGRSWEVPDGFQALQILELLQEVMEEVKILKEAQPKGKELPEVHPEVRTAGTPSWGAE